MTGTDWLVVDALAPDPEGTLAPLYRAAAAGGVSMPYCGRCDAVLELEQEVCDRCEAVAVVWRQVEPAGAVHACTAVHRVDPSLTGHDVVPYHVFDVELASGHRVVLTSSEPLDTPPRIGDRVGIGFRTIGATAVPALLLAAPRTDNAMEEEQ